MRSFWDLESEQSITTAQNHVQVSTYFWSHSVFFLLCLIWITEARHVKTVQHLCHQHRPTSDFNTKHKSKESTPREIERERQTDRQTERDRQTDRQTERERGALICKDVVDNKERHGGKKMKRRGRGVSGEERGKKKKSIDSSAGSLSLNR